MSRKRAEIAKPNPAVSVIVPNWNMAHLLPRSLETCCNQPVPPDEVLILDDCSTDASMDVIDDYCRRFPFVRCIRYSQKSEDWVVAAMQYVKDLRGDYIHMFAADDQIHQGFYKAIKDEAATNHGVGCIFAHFHHLGYEGLPFRISRFNVDESCRFEAGDAVSQFFLASGAHPGGMASVMRRDL